MYSTNFMPVIGVPYSLPPKHLPRPRLADTVIESLATRQMAVVRAPAGFGKTVLLTECLHHDAFPALSVRLESHRPEAAALLSSYLTQIESHYRTAFDRARQGIAESDLSTGAWAQDERREAGHAPRLLVIDDYHAGATEALNQQLCFVIEHLPSWRIILSTRTQPDLPWARWEADGRLVTYTEHELRFTAQETAQLVESILGYAPSPRMIQLLEENFSGWALALVLSASAYQSRPPADYLRLLEYNGGRTRAIDDYLAREVMRAQLHNPQEAEFLQRTAILSELAVDVCNEYLDIENAGELLEGLQRRGMFVTQTDEDGDRYQYLAPFSLFLQAKLHRTIGASGVRKLHYSAAEVYERQGIHWAAIHHYLLAQAFEPAAELIAAYGHLLLDRKGVGDYGRDGRASGADAAGETLVGWLNQLPLSVVDTQPRLTYLKARALVSRGSYSQARPLLERALDGIRAQQDGVAELRAATDLAMSSYAEGRYREAVDVLQTVLPAEHAEPAAQAEALLCEAKSRSALDEIRAALAAGERALEAASAVEAFEQRSDLQRRVSRELAELSLALGDVETAEGMAHRAVQIEDDRERARGAGYEQSLHTLMRVLVARGDFMAAQHIGDEWAALGRSEPDGGRRLVDLYRLRGWIALVEQEDEGAEVYFRRAGNRGVDCVALQALQDDWHEARYLAELEADARRTVLPQRAWHIARTWLGLAESQLGSIERGRELLEGAAVYFAEKELRYWQAGAELQLAWLLKRMGERGLSRRFLSDALGFGARNHMMNYAFWHPDVIASACADALSMDLCSDYVTELACRRLKPAQARYFQPLLYRSVGRQRARLARIVKELTVADGAGHNLTYGARDVSQAVEELVVQGYLTPEGALKLATTHQLTRREIEVFTLYVHPNIRGEERQVNDAIAVRLVLSKSTVRNYISSILKKLCATGWDRLQVRSWAVAEGIVSD